MNEIKSFTSYTEYYELITLLKTRKERAEMTLTIYEYIHEDKEPNFEKGTDLYKVWNNLSKPLCKSKENSKNVSKRYTNNNTNEDTKCGTKRDTHQDVSVICNMSLEKEIIRGKTFTKPTVEEIVNYCTERNNNVDANNFYDFYESKGWKVGNQAMKDWKACIRTWEKKGFTKQTPEWFDKEIKPTEDLEKKKELSKILEEFR